MVISGKKLDSSKLWGESCSPNSRLLHADDEDKRTRWVNTFDTSSVLRDSTSADFNDECITTTFPRIWVFCKAAVEFSVYILLDELPS